MTSGSPLPDGWRHLEADAMSQREQNCRTALARILGGDGSDPAEPYPRIAVCLGGASNWDTPLSCVAFLDGLSAPLHASSTLTGTNGAKLIDTVSTISCSGTASWVMGATLATAAAAVDVPAAASNTRATPFHGMLQASNSNDPWCGRGPVASATTDGDHNPHGRETLHQPRNPWLFGPSNFFHDDVHTYNGLVEMFSSHYLGEAAQIAKVGPMHRLVVAAAVGNGLIVPCAIVNPALGDSSVARWTAFLRNVWLPNTKNESPASTPKKNNNNSSSRGGKSDESGEADLSLFDTSLAAVVRSGDLPFTIFAAVDIRARRTLHATATAHPDGRSWCSESLRWMEFSPLYVRCAAPLTPVVAGTREPERSRQSRPSKAVLCTQPVALRVDTAGAGATLQFAESIASVATASGATTLSPESSPSGMMQSRNNSHPGNDSAHDGVLNVCSVTDVSGDVVYPVGAALGLDHVLSLCASGLPLTIVEQGYVYLQQRGDSSDASPTFGETGNESTPRQKKRYSDNWGTSDDEALVSLVNTHKHRSDEPHDPRKQSFTAATATPINAATASSADSADDYGTATLGGRLSSPPPSPRLLASVVADNAAHLPWAAVPLYLGPHGHGRRSTSSPRPVPPTRAHNRAEAVQGGASAAAATTAEADESGAVSRASTSASGTVQSSRGANAQPELFATCRDSTASFRTPLPSLLAACSDRQFDIIVVHDTAPSSSYPRIPDSLAHAIELGFYELDERAVADSSLTTAWRSGSSSSASTSASSSCMRPFDREEAVRVFHGAPGYPTILYFFGLPGRRCLESALDADVLRTACHDVRALVMEQVAPLLINEARRWRYRRHTNFSCLSPMQERALRVVPTRYAVVAPPQLGRDHTVMEEIWAHVQRRDAVHEGGGSPVLPGRQMVVDYTGVEIICLCAMELKGVRDQVSTLAFYQMVLSVFFDRLSPARRASMLQHLRASALQYLGSGGETRAWHPLSHFFPTMDEEERRVLCMALHFNVFQWRRVVAPSPARRDFKSSLRAAATRARGGGASCATDSATHEEGQEEVQVSLRPFSAVYFAFGALLSVFRPQDERLFEKGELQVGSVGDFFRIEWLRSNQSVMLIYMVCLGSLYLGAWEEVKEVLSDAFAQQISSFLDSAQAREHSMHRQQRSSFMSGCAQPKTIIELDEDDVEEASLPLASTTTAEALSLRDPETPTRHESRTRRSSNSSRSRHGDAQSRVGPGTPPGVSGYATSAAIEPLSALDLGAFCTALALALEAMFVADAAGGSQKGLEMLNRIDYHLRRVAAKTSSLPASSIISAPASYTRGCYLNYPQIFFTSLMMSIARHCYSAAFFQQIYEFCAATHFVVSRTSPLPGEAKFFWLHTTEALCGNVNISVRQECQKYMFRRIGADLDEFAANVAAARPVPAENATDRVYNLWALPSGGHMSFSYATLREAYAYALPNVLTLLIRYARDDVDGFMSVLSATPSILADSRIQRRRLGHCIHRFLAHGWTDWRVFCFMVRTLVAKRVRMPYLAPAVYHLVIPCYLERPLECGSLLRYAVCCKRLETLIMRPAAKRPATAAAVVAVAPSKETLPSVKGRHQDRSTSSSSGSGSGSGVPSATMGDTRVRRRCDRSADEMQAAVEEDVLAPLADGYGASTQERAAAAEIRRLLPPPLQVLFDKAFARAEENRRNAAQRPAEKVDHTISTMIATQRF